MNAMVPLDKFKVEIDLDTAQRVANAVRERLLELRERFDLSKWEYTRTVRVAPLERPHSHPVLTLNGQHIHDEEAFLSTYLHEQIHWGLDLHRSDETAHAIVKLRAAYPDAHRGLPETGDDEYTTYLHLVVNWLEIFAAAEFIGRERAQVVALRAEGYFWIYRTTIDDREPIEAILREAGILPFPPATAERSSAPVPSLQARGESVMDPEASYMFTHAICRRPGRSVVHGLRASDAGDPDFDAFAREHAAYVEALAGAGVEVTVLEPLETWPDSVFVEDPALCVAGVAIVLRPGAPSRFGERDAARAVLREHFDAVIDLGDGGFVDGGDILVTGREVLVGLSMRTDSKGVEALSLIMTELGLPVRVIRTPSDILHFKTDCGLLDDETVFCTKALAASGCFAGYRVIECPEGEEAAANLIRVNGVVLASAGHPGTVGLLAGNGYDVRTISTAQAARLDGGLSCMSLRFRLPAAFTG